MYMMGYELVGFGVQKSLDKMFMLLFEYMAQEEQKLPGLFSKKSVEVGVASDTSLFINHCGNT
jgi:hypothetical protein